MKVRQDFVTNSSSSSYIIAFKQIPEVDDETKKKYPWLVHVNDIVWNLIKTDSNPVYETDIISTKEELDRMMIDDYSYCVSPPTLEGILADWSMNDLYNKMLKHINMGYKIIRKDISYDNEGLSKIIKAIAVNNEDFIIIDSDD